MPYANIILYALAFFTIGMAAYCILASNIIRAVFALFGALFGVAGLFVMANAPFLGMVHIVLYVGGMLVLVVFGVMLSDIEWLNTNMLTKKSFKPTFSTLINITLCLILAVVLGKIILFVPWDNLTWIKNALTALPQQDTTSNIGSNISGTFGMALEWLSVLLLVVLVGSLGLVRKTDSAQK